MKGINFIEPLFHKVPSGEKRQTRRIMNPQPKLLKNMSEKLFLDELNINPSRLRGSFKPRYKLGETLYIKEPYCLYQTLNYVRRPDGRSFSEVSDGLIGYKYDGHDSIEDFKRHIRLMGESDFEKVITDKDKWSNKLFMPAKFARYYIEITGVCCERLQDISNEDCFAEGIMSHRHWGDSIEWFTHSNGLHGGYNTPREAYAALIDSINGRGTWKSNPFVWVYDFKLKNIN